MVFRSGSNGSELTLVYVGAVGLLAGLGALLLVTRGSSLLSGILLLRSLGGDGSLVGGTLVGSSFGRHFGWFER